MARRSEHTQEQIKEMVLNAAESIVVDEGIEALTARKIAMEIGYTVGSIYMVFANMQDLLMHVKGRTLDQLAEQLGKSQGEGEAEQRIGALASTYLDFASRNYNRWRIVFESEAPDTPEPPAWYRQKVEQMFMPIEALFRQLSAESERTDLAARTLWAAVHGICVLSLNGNLSRAGVESAQIAVSTLVENFIRGWKA